MLLRLDHLAQYLAPFPGCVARFSSYLVRMTAAAVHWTLDPQAGTDLSPVPLTKNQHWTVDPDGKKIVDFSFVEGPFGMPAKTGYGSPILDFRDSLGPDMRYKVVRKLGEFEHLARPRLAVSAPLHNDVHSLPGFLQ